MKLLIVEDEQILADVFREKFEKAGFETKVAIDGDVVPTVRSFAPDAIILDLLLPKKNGFDVLAELKDDEALKQIPVIVVSNLGEDADIKKAIALGAKDYFVKSQHPINEIVEKVKNIMIVTPK